MKAINTTHYLVGLVMLAAAGLALALTPRQKVADEGPEIRLEAMIPEQFGEWKLDRTIAPLRYRPEFQSQIDQIYSQTLTRAYLNRQGERIMLSIAYGSDQGYASQVHRPEMCYPAQGYQVGSTTKAVIVAGGTRLPVMKLVATQGRMVEPITYWVMIGESAVRGNMEQHVARLKYGLTGKIPYGMVIRVSILSPNVSQSYDAEARFVQDMLAAVPAPYRRILAGTGA